MVNKEAVFLTQQRNIVQFVQCFDLTANGIHCLTLEYFIQVNVIRLENVQRRINKLILLDKKKIYEVIFKKLRIFCQKFVTAISTHSNNKHFFENVTR